MPTKNPRINVVLEKPLYKNVERIARKDGVSLSLKVRDLVKEALEMEEDIALASIAGEREKTFNSIMRTALSVSLPKSMSEELDRLAKSTGRDKRDIIKESLGLFLWEMKLKAVQKRLGPKAKKLGIVSEDDVFKAFS